MNTLRSEQIKTAIEKISEFRGAALQQEIVQILDTHVDYYNWTGFYFMNDEAQQLELGPYVGAHTDHDRIPYGRGICGQVAVSGQTFEVPNVHAQDNYLACSLETKSEIVVPMYSGDVLVGQLDIDSHVLDPFTEEDHNLLNWVVNFVAERL
ncbi:MAG: hypothetical protein RL754_59 [Bacteroidota bacterium]|jgi:GAF domain-containing protein